MSSLTLKAHQTTYTVNGGARFIPTSATGGSASSHHIVGLAFTPGDNPDLWNNIHAQRFQYALNTLEGQP